MLYLVRLKVRLLHGTAVRQYAVAADDAHTAEAKARRACEDYDRECVITDATVNAHPSDVVRVR